MTTEDQAATCIQARFRGVLCREEQRRGIRAVTRLQALQRGRFTRREFAKLREFSREQEGFQQATRRRQIRIWRNEQELYFLQHTNAADLERVRAFQQQHSARVIQRTWRATSRVAVPVNEAKTEVFNPSDRVYLFNSFGLAPLGSARFDHWTRDKEYVETSQSSPSLLVSDDDIRASVVNQKLSPAVADAEAFAKKREAIQERIKRLVAQDKSKEDFIVKKPKTPRSSNVTEGSKVQANRRRELYENLIEMKYATAQRVLRYDRETRASRPERELLSAKRIVSCENRIKHLRMERPDQLTPSKEDNQLDDIMGKWDEARRVRAWNHHRRAVCSVLEKRYWWQTQLAGEQRDIRDVVVAKSPWEDENSIWVWPRSASSNQRETDAGTSLTCSVSSSSVWPSVEIHNFLVGDHSSKETQNPSLKVVGDDEASEWWRAHCTQSHLASNGALQLQNPYTAEFSNNVSNEGDVYPVCTSEAVANRDLYALQQRAKRAARTKSLEHDIEQRVKILTAQVERRVHEMEVQVESNTQLALEIVKRKQEQRARISHEQQAAMTIQRHARGMQGRRCARERRAEFFVMVRGRAIRRGRCEECGDERAVLECQQCEESLHFCPLCWVHVHSTRRRKIHVAIPMTTVVNPAPVHESAKPQGIADASINSSKAAVVSFEENAGPRLRSLPSPRKQNKIRSAEPAPVGLKNSVNSNDRRAKSSKEDSQNTATPTVFDTQKNTAPELAEACALARRARAELGEAPLAATESSIVRELKSAAHESLADSGDIDFSTVDGDGAAMSEFEIARDEQLAADESSEPAEIARETAKPSEIVEAQTEIMQSTNPEPLELPSESHSVHVPMEDFSALPPDTSVFAAAVRIEEQKAKLIAGITDGSPSLESNDSSENQPVENIPEVLSTREIELTNEFAVAEGADAISNAAPSESQEMPVTVEQVSGVSLTDEAATGLVHVDTCPSETPVSNADSSQLRG